MFCNFPANKSTNININFGYTQNEMMDENNDNNRGNLFCARFRISPSSSLPTSTSLTKRRRISR